ncbi:hypothetical protein EGW08_014757, partial [Elysia chlorotica]
DETLHLLHELVVGVVFGPRLSGRSRLWEGLGTDHPGLFLFACINSKNQPALLVAGLSLDLERRGHEARHVAHLALDLGLGLDGHPGLAGRARDGSHSLLPGPHDAGRGAEDAAGAWVGRGEARGQDVWRQA